jgi:hypothetical protein
VEWIIFEVARRKETVMYEGSGTGWDRERRWGGDKGIVAKGNSELVREEFGVRVKDWEVL